MESFRFGDQLTPGGYRIDEVTSALQKEIRRGNEWHALQWATELALAGYTNYVWKRLRIIASEDVGLGEPMMAVLIRMLYENWQRAEEGRPGRRAARQPVPHPRGPGPLPGAEEPAGRPRLRRRHGRPPAVPDPDYALDKHTKRGREMGRGIPHFYAEGAVVSPEAAVEDPYLERALEVDEQLEGRRRQGSSGISATATSPSSPSRSSAI